MAKSEFTSVEKTFVLIKPDGVKRGLVGKIFSRFEAMGLKLAAARMVMATKEQAYDNYPGTDKWYQNLGEKTYINYDNDEDAIAADMGTSDKIEIGRKIHAGLADYLTSGPVIVMVWEGNHAVKVVRKLAGSTTPDRAEMGTIRGDFGFDSSMLAVKSGRLVFQNMLHISESVEEAEREIDHWFGDKYKDLSDYHRIDYAGSYEAFA